jgi:hypothetical protein
MLACLTDYTTTIKQKITVTEQGWRVPHRFIAITSYRQLGNRRCLIDLEWCGL